ncbi:MAG TPA: holo-ACP synthase [Phycisphaerales bacterium]|nr:holo-ACP synthase [Phycisphaerales bacterium]
MSSGPRTLAHGIDMVEVARIRAMLERHAERFLERVFTKDEAAYAADHQRRPEHLAARFAAKEAVLKALGTGWSNGVAWTEIEVCREPSGRPTLRLTGRAASLAQDRGISEWLISITHTEQLACASVIALGE